MEMEGIKGIKGIRQLNYKFLFICTNVIVENNQFNKEVGDEDLDEKEEQNYANQEPEENDEKDKLKFDENTIYEKIFGHLTQNQIETVM